jgi:hypothetical protein
MAWWLKPVGRESLETGYRARWGLGETVSEERFASLVRMLYDRSYWEHAPLGQPDMLGAALDSYRWFDEGDTDSTPPAPASPGPTPTPSPTGRRRQPRPVPEPPKGPDDEDDEEPEERTGPQPFEPATVPPSGPPPELERLLEPNPNDGKPDSRTTFGRPRDYSAGVPGRPMAPGIGTETTTRQMARNNLPPFSFGPDQPLEWPHYTPPVGQPGPLGDLGVDIGWGTQGGAGWQALHRRATGWSRQQMTRVPSAYKALHQVGRRTLY